ncbi:hypothetical protein L1857_14825 [Amycolatopsis thermalba]|uniref:Uncharacterized protein n=1 Tax=Amycolatopsis thermalba TaxID=944492 RepID=A0ABY4NVC5_9PSEU|nr:MULTISPECIES: hypothetical protein [Amycolatopsis]UQS24012.1 hypothetical protein L1857_14825 [Amycolatopsis thermalba]
MAIGEFVVPEERDFLDVLRVVPEPVPDEVDTWGLRYSCETGEDLELSYDYLGRSIFLRISAGGCVTYECFREGVTRLMVESRPDSRNIVAEFASTGMSGTLDISVYPAVQIVDKLFYS